MRYVLALVALATVASVVGSLPMSLGDAIARSAAVGCSLQLVGEGWPAQRVTVDVVHTDGLCVWRARPVKD